MKLSQDTRQGVSVQKAAGHSKMPGHYAPFSVRVVWERGFYFEKEEHGYCGDCSCGNNRNSGSVLVSFKA